MKFFAIRSISLSDAKGIVRHFKKFHQSFNAPFEIPSKLLEALEYYGITRIYADRAAQKILSGKMLAQKFLKKTRERDSMTVLSPRPPAFEALKFDLYSVYGHFGLHILANHDDEMFIGAGEKMVELLGLHFKNWSQQFLDVGDSKKLDGPQ